MSDLREIDINDDDANALRAALHVMAGWETDIFALCDLSNCSVLGGKLDAPAGRRNTRVTTQPYRARRVSKKLEKVQLTSEVERLQNVVNHCKTAWMLHDTQLSEGTRALRLECASMAARQRKLRLAAELENQKLWGLYESQLHEARKMAALTKKVDAIQLSLDAVPTVTTAPYDGPVVDWHEQLLYLDILAAEAPDLFASGKFAAHPDGDFRDIQYRAIGPNALQVEFSMSWLLPFSVARVSQALWIQTTRMNRAERSTKCQDIYTGSDVLVSTVVSEPIVHGTLSNRASKPIGGASHGQIATRLEPEATDGSVLLVSAIQAKIFSKPSAAHEDKGIVDGDSDHEAKGLMEGEGLLRVEPVGSVRSMQPLTRVKWIRRVRGSPPDHLAGSPANPRRWNQDVIQGFTRQAWQRNLNDSVQAVENMLLSESVVSNYNS